MTATINTGTGMGDVNAALDVLFNHPNVGPFITRRLIQRMVTSNPSPAYIERVSAVFADNGEGVRGDMKAVIRAILLDPEARDCKYYEHDQAGMLREPLVRYTHLMRSLNASSPSGEYRNDMDMFYELTTQRPLSAPTVFNFFRPDYQPNGLVEQAGLVAPEFQITNSRTVVGYANIVHEWIMDEDPFERTRIFSGETLTEDTEVTLDWEEYILMIESGDMEQVIEEMNLLLCHGQMSDRTRDVIATTVTNAVTTGVSAELQLKLILFSIMVSPDYLIFR